MRSRRMGRPGARIGFPLSVGSEAEVVTLIHAFRYVAPFDVVVVVVVVDHIAPAIVAQHRHPGRG